MNPHLHKETVLAHFHRRASHRLLGRRLRFRSLMAMAMSAAVVSSLWYAHLGHLAGGSSGRLLARRHEAAPEYPFPVAAAWRLWVVGAGLGTLMAVRRRRPYSGPDLLGCTGNGGLFYAGIRATMHDPGQPARRIPGLARPRTKSAWRARRSVPGHVLKRYGADCPTAVALAGMLVAHADTSDLLGASERLHAALAAHLGDASSGHPLCTSLRRVLTPEMTPAMDSVSPCEIAALVLALEVGRLLGRMPGWGRRYPHLAARASILGLPSFAEDFAPDEQDRLRQAMVYASRHGAFGALPFPRGLTPAASAMRQWSELILAWPHSSVDAAFDLERRALERYILGRWHPDYSRSFRRSLFHTPSVVYVEAEALIASLLQSVGPDPLVRLAALLPESDRDALEPHELTHTAMRLWPAARHLLSVWGWLAVKDAGTTDLWFVRSGPLVSAGMVSLFRRAMDDDAAQPFGKVQESAAHVEAVEDPSVYRDWLERRLDGTKS